MSFWARCVVLLACALVAAYPELLHAIPGPNTMENHIRCGPTDDDPLSVYQENLAFVLADLVFNTGSNNNEHYSQRGTGQDRCYGHSTCHAILSAQFCISCLQAAQTKSMQRCGFSRSVDVSLRDCSLAYQEGPF